MKRLLILFLSIVFLNPVFAQDEETAEPIETVEEQGFVERLDQAFGNATGWFVNGVFYTIQVNTAKQQTLADGSTVPVTIGIPWVLIPLIFGALFFTIIFRFPGLRLLKVSLWTVRGLYEHKTPPELPSDINVIDGDQPDTIRVEGSEGEVSHFQALTAALSATVGLGNIAGVAVAIAVGGPGATFWMIIAGLIGMSSKFVECTLGVRFREIDENGRVYGGPMYYLTKGLEKKGMKGLGKVLAVIFAVMCVGGSFGGGNMFQANQAASIFMQEIGVSGPFAGMIFGMVMAVLVGVVIIGGIKRIASVTERVVPFMASIYVIAGLVVLAMNYSLIPTAFSMIFSEAFAPTAIAGGVLGVLVQGFRRAAFSNEAGIGSAAIAHSAVKTKYPASEGVVALLEPLIDTVFICTMTALVIVITNIHGQFLTYGDATGLNGVDLTSVAFDSAIPHFSKILVLAVLLFAFSTMISWSYYGLQSWTFLFGKSKKQEMIYKLQFCFFVVLGASIKLGSVLDFSDAMIFAMMVPNMIGLFFLFPYVREELNKYLAHIKDIEGK